jgi:hypothetical protein
MTLSDFATLSNAITRAASRFTAFVDSLLPPETLAQRGS